MSDGLSWAYEQEKAQKKYQEHVASGKFNKQYLESDINRYLSASETRLLVVRLIIHSLGGWSKFLSEESDGAFYVQFKKLTKKAKIEFVKGYALELGLELGPTAKMEKLRKKLEEMQELMHPRSEE